MSLPSPLLTLPGITNDQLSFNGVTLGASPFGLKLLEGLDKPDVRSGNTDRPRTRGANVGLNLLKTRTITVTMDVGPPYGSYGTLAAALSALRSATSTEGATEYPLWIKLPGFPQVCCMARVLKRGGFKWDITADLAGLVQSGAIQFEATDPHFYASPTLAPSVGLPGPSGGFGFPLSFPLSFGGSTSPNQLSITNNGDVPCWPVLVITGPCLNPSVQNLSIAGNPSVSFGIQLNAGDVLMVDNDAQSIMFTPSGQSVAAPYPQVLQSGSTYFALPANSTSQIVFNSQDTSAAAGTLAVWGASAYESVL